MLCHKTDSDTPVMVTTFNPDIEQLIRDNYYIIQNAVELSSIFEEKPMMGFRSLPSLRDKLTSAKTTFPPLKMQDKWPVVIPVCPRLRKCTCCLKI